MNFCAFIASLPLTLGQAAALAFLFIAAPPLSAQSQKFDIDLSPPPYILKNPDKFLENPIMIKNEAVHIGKNWFRLETDAHILTEKVTFTGSAEFLRALVIKNCFLDGKKTKLTTKIVSLSPAEFIDGKYKTTASLVDFTGITLGPLGIKIKSEYRVNLKIALENKDRFVVELRQNIEDNAHNNDIKNIYALRSAEEITINDKKYIYIRFYTIQDINAYILIGAKKIFERDSISVNFENLQLVLESGKGKPEL